MNYIQEFSVDRKGIEKFTQDEFAKTSYGEEKPDTVRLLAQIAADKVRDFPTSTVHLTMKGGDVRLTYISYEMFLPQKIAQVDAECDTSIKEMVKYLKKEYKTRSKKTLELKERKDKVGEKAINSGRTIEKVSMNHRYMYVSWKTFEIG